MGLGKILGRFTAKQEVQRNPAEMIVWFEEELARHEDRIYGVGLFFEGIRLLHSEQEDVVETHRKAMRNTIQAGREIAERAQTLLKQVKEAPSATPLLKQFSFSMFEGQPDADKMMLRAEILMECYKNLFPDRPRSEPFKDDEAFLLFETASNVLADVEAAQTASSRR